VLGCVAFVVVRAPREGAVHLTEELCMM